MRSKMALYVGIPKQNGSWNSNNGNTASEHSRITSSFHQLKDLIKTT